MLLRVSVVGLLVLAPLVRGADAATVAIEAPAALQLQVLLYDEPEGAFVPGAPGTIRVGYNSNDVVYDSRGVYEFFLPTLPTGGTYTAAEVRYVVANTRTETYDIGTEVLVYGSQLQFSPYAGNGRYDESDGYEFGDSALSDEIVTTGPRSTALNVGRVNALSSGGTTWLGINAAQADEKITYHTDLSRGGGAAGAAPSIVYTASVPDSGTLITRPLFDRLASTTGGTAGPFSGSEEDSEISTVELGNVLRRGVQEYSLAGLPDGATVTGATLTLNVTGSTGADGLYAEPRIYGYVGNGVFNSADALTTNATLLGTGTTVDRFGEYLITLDPAALQDLLAVGDTIGLIVRSSSDSSIFRYATLEGGDGAALSVAYAAVPEPTTVALLLPAATMLLRRRRTQTA